MSKMGIFDIIPLTAMLVLWLSGHLNLVRAIGSVVAVATAGLLVLMFSFITAMNLDPQHSIPALFYGGLLIVLSPWLGLILGYASSQPVAVSPVKQAHRAYEALPPRQKARLHRGLIKLATATVKVAGPHVAAHLRKKERHTLAGIVEDTAKLL